MFPIPPLPFRSMTQAISPLQPEWPHSHAISTVSFRSSQYVLQYFSVVIQVQDGWAHFFVSAIGDSPRSSDLVRTEIRMQIRCRTVSRKLSFYLRANAFERGASYPRDLRYCRTLH